MASKTVTFPALSRLDRLLLLAAAVALFVLLDGPVWGHLFDWDRAIGWSYAAVPVLVLLALAARRRYSSTAWFLHSLELIFWKFAITAGILLLLLVRANPQGPAPATSQVTTTPQATIALPPPPAARGRLEGRVLRAGAPAPRGTLVFISSGLDGFAWPPPAVTLELSNDGRGFLPALTAAQAGEAITAISSDHRLHTLLMTQEGRAWRLNVPVLASGAPTPVRPGQVEGVVDLTCAIHGAIEHASRLVLLRHPFFQFVHSDGTFSFDGVPTGPVTLTAIADDGTRAQTAATVRADGTEHTEWSLPAAASSGDAGR
jgi:hypothetical protein